MNTKALLSRFLPKSRNRSTQRPLPVAPPEDASDSSVYSLRMHSRTAFDDRASRFKFSRYAEMGRHHMAFPDVSNRIRSHSDNSDDDDDDDDNDDYELPVDGNCIRHEETSHPRNPNTSHSAISSNSYERVKDRIESPTEGCVELQSNRPSNSDCQRFGGRSRMNPSPSSLCQNHIGGSVSDEQVSPSLYEVNESTQMKSLIADSYSGTGWNREHPRRRRAPPPPPPPPLPPQTPQRQQYLRPLRGPSDSGDSSMKPLRSEDVTEHIGGAQYYGDTGASMTININGPINIHTHSFIVTGGQSNSQHPEIALDGLEHPFQKHLGPYDYTNNLLERYIQEHRRSFNNHEPTNRAQKVMMNNPIY